VEATLILSVSDRQYSAGQKAAVLKELKQIFHPTGIRWTIQVTLGEGDAFQQAQELVAKGAELIAVYGGTEPFLR
jgi:diacylglycerol kinase family enzyme